jgi:hypothetical protein
VFRSFLRGQIFIGSPMVAIRRQQTHRVLHSRRYRCYFDGDMPSQPKAVLGMRINGRIIGARNCM